jgi:Na+-translocating ferredoxin:NAD+ oxidoreductase RnfC subunit
MSEKEAILRVSATWHLKLEVGRKVHRGDRIQDGPETDGPATAPVSGVVKSIEFDPGSHEFVIVIAPPA